MEALRVLEIMQYVIKKEDKGNDVLKAAFKTLAGQKYEDDNQWFFLSKNEKWSENHFLNLNVAKLIAYDKANNFERKSEILVKLRNYLLEKY